MPKAISYMRFSAAHQGKGSTIERQSAYIQTWLDLHPEIELSDLSAKDEGMSGFTGKHLDHGLGRILTAIKSGVIQSGDFILVEAIDRIGRLEPMDMMHLISDITKSGVTIETLEDGQSYSLSRLNNDHSALFILIGKIQQAHDYSKKLSDRISAAYTNKRMRARNGDSITINTPVWLTTSGKLIHPYSDMVTQCIELYLKGYSANLIIKKLKDEYPKLETTHPETLKKWFKSRALIGDWANKGDHIPNVFEPLIDKDTFYKLQREIERRYKHMSPPNAYELSGLVVCELCNSNFYFRTKKNKNYTIIYANCSRYLKFGKDGCTNNKTWPYEVLKVIADRTTSGDIISSSINTVSKQHLDTLKTLESELEEANKRQKYFIGLAHQTMNDTNITDAITSLSSQITEIKDNIKKTEESLSQSDSLNSYEIDDLMSEIHHTNSDPRLKQKRLKASNYRISINQNKAKPTVKYNDDINTFTLIKRSTRHKCYLVSSTTEMHSGTARALKYTMMLQGVDLPPDFEINTNYVVAINRHGSITQRTGSDLTFLLEDLESHRTI